MKNTDWNRRFGNHIYVKLGTFEIIDGSASQNKNQMKDNISGQGGNRKGRLLLACELIQGDLSTRSLRSLGDDNAYYLLR
ncbi:MAG: hypothetical protein JJU13_16470 [Balneolaceae bacterium]|nr:hypothetical protein [Balneolaceae bacterium]